MWNIPVLQRFIKSLPKPEPLKVSERKYKFCVVGGTFDRLHIGHKTLLTTAEMFSEKLLVCISSDTFVKKMKKIAMNKIEPFHTRKHALEEFLTEISVTFILCELNDPFTPALYSEYADNLDSIIISSDPDIVERTKMLNNLRKSNNLNPLSIIKIPLIRDPLGKIISSTRYRIDDYFPEPRPPEFVVKRDLMEHIRKPKGVIVDGPQDLPDPNEFRNKGIIVIGDEAFRNLARIGYPISTAILDFKVRRTPLFYTVLRFSDDIKAVPAIPSFNPPGRISTFSWFSTLVGFVQKEVTIIRVFGEEDLMGFPATILAPHDALIIYGDPFRKKLVYFRVSDKHKQEALSLIKKMTIVPTKHRS